MVPKCEQEVNWVSVCLSLFLSTLFSFEVDRWVLHQSVILPTSLRLAWLMGRISRRLEGGRTVPYMHVCPQMWLWQIPKNDWGSGHTSVLGPSTQLLCHPFQVGLLPPLTTEVWRWAQQVPHSFLISCPHFYT